MGHPTLLQNFYGIPDVSMMILRVVHPRFVPSAASGSGNHIHSLRHPSYLNEWPQIEALLTREKRSSEGDKNQSYIGLA
jgi:hypothetical protein